MAGDTVEVFFSYSHKDEELRDELAKHLRLLEREKIISAWHDRKITPGSDWAGDIDHYLSQADIILLLVSADFLDSDYCWNVEIRKALERHKAGEATVIPVILRPVDWSSADFGSLQALPKNAKPVVTWNPPDLAFVDIAKGIRSKAKELARKKRPMTVDTPADANAFTELLGNGGKLEMVKIPGGRFWMGSPEGELERLDEEGPQHSVTVPEFWMGKYAVTQAQWSEVAALPKVSCDLKPFPANFRGDNRPVEQVSWYEAVEFCQRLSGATGRAYRLPSEAEWEYACRARTTTPFYFGDTITPDQVNYDGNYAYGSGPKGVYREETTEVGKFPPNVFGLYDMHGNVWEWCADHWHDSYEGAPTDGTAWLSRDESSLRVLRGGSWDYNPRSCRSAYRRGFIPGFRSIIIGFRVCCSAPRTFK